MRSSPSSASRQRQIRLDDAYLLTHQYRLRRVGDEGRLGIFYAMIQFVGPTRRSILAALLGVVLAFLGTLTTSGQTAPSQGPPIISSVEVQYVGPQTISREKVLAQIRTKPGQPYSESLVEQDIKALYQTGAVQNVRIFGQADGERVKVMV
ncbi:MAG: outer membrane protein insertion porin family, partial [Verrucomicrobiota bacterium]